VQGLYTITVVCGVAIVTSESYRENWKRVPIHVGGFIYIIMSLGRMPLVFFVSRRGYLRLKGSPLCQRATLVEFQTSVISEGIVNKIKISGGRSRVY
jgi:hypothetical protein